MTWWHRWSMLIKSLSAETDQLSLHFQRIPSKRTVFFLKKGHFLKRDTLKKKGYCQLELLIQDPRNPNAVYTISVPALCRTSSGISDWYSWKQSWLKHVCALSRATHEGKSEKASSKPKQWQHGAQALSLGKQLEGPKDQVVNKEQEEIKPGETGRLLTSSDLKLFPCMPCFQKASTLSWRHTAKEKHKIRPERGLSEPEKPGFLTSSDDGKRVEKVCGENWTPGRRTKLQNHCRKTGLKWLIGSEMRITF